MLGSVASHRVEVLEVSAVAVKFVFAEGGNWTVFNSNPWGGNERQVAGAFHSKQFNAPQSDSEKAQDNQFSLDGLNFMQSNLRPEFAKSQSENQQLSLNGFMHASQVSRARQNEANVLGMVTESDLHNPMSRGLPVLEEHLRSGPQHSNITSVSFGMMEAPVNFDFLGSQQQMNSQQPGILHSLPRQQSGTDDVHLWQQQAMLKQMQDLHRRQQLQQLEAIQRNSVNQTPTLPNQTAGNHSPAFLNDTTLNNGPNYPWPLQVMAGNTKWLQHGVSAGEQGYSNGVIMPEQGQALRLMGLIPQQASQSLYGVPVSSTRSVNPFLQGHIDKPGMHQVSVHNSPLSGNQHAFFPEQISMREGTTVPRLALENKISLEHGSGHDSANLFNVENLNQLQHRTVNLPELGGRQDVARSLELLPEKTEKQVASAQDAVALDPTEEKILFGSDDNIWEAFGGSVTTGSGSYSHLDGALPSVQSGSWSALMQSAVAESSSGDLGMQGEWNGVGVRKSGSLMENLQPSMFHDSEKQQAAWIDGLQPASLSSRPLPNDANLGSNFHTAAEFQGSFLNQPRESLQNTSSQQSSEEGRKRLDCSQPQMPEGSQVPEISYSSAEFDSRGVSGSWSHQPSISLHGRQTYNRPSSFNLVESVPQNRSAASKNQGTLNSKDCGRGVSVNIAHGGTLSRPDSVPNLNFEMDSPKFNSKDETAVHISSNSKVNQEPTQKPSDNQLNFWRTVSSSVKSSTDDSRKYQQQLSKGPQVFDSSVSCADKGAIEMHELGTADRRENSSDSHSLNLSHHALLGCLRDNVWSGAGDTRNLTWGKQESSGQVGRKTPAPRDFLYHTMGELDMDVDPAYGIKHHMQSQAMNHSVSGVLRSHQGQSRFLHPISNSSLDSELQVHVPNIQGDVEVSYEVPSNGINPGYIHGASAYLDRSGGDSASDKPLPSSQNMLELLHKVDQSREQRSIGQFSSNKLSGMREAEGSYGTIVLSPKQSSASQSFGLQLAPPSQGHPIPNFMMASQTSLQNISSPNSSNFASDTEDRAHEWLAPADSVQSLPALHETCQGESRNNKSGIPGQVDANSLQYNVPGNFSAPFAPESLYQRSLPQNEHINDEDGKMITNQPRHLLFEGVSCGKHIDDSRDQAHSAPVLVSSAAGSILHNNLASQREISQLKSMDQSDRRVSMQQMLLMDVSPTQPPVVHSVPKMANLSTVGPNVLANFTTPQQMLAAQSHNMSDLLKSRFPTNQYLEASSCIQHKQADQDALRKGGAINAQGVASGGKQPVKEVDPDPKTSTESRGKESIVVHSSVDSLSKSGATPKDIEAFGRSLKPNNDVHDDYSLPHQMQGMKSVEVDHGDQHLKRFVGANNFSDTQLMAVKAGEMFSGALVSSGDAKMLSISVEPEPVIDQEKSASSQLLCGNVDGQDVLTFLHGDSEKHSGSDVTPIVEHPHVSPQTLKNGQLLPMHDACRTEIVTSMEQQYVTCKFSKNLVRDHSVGLTNPVFDNDQMANAWHTITSVLSDQFHSPLPLAPGVMTSVTPKKRKSASADLLPWHKEVELGSKRFQTISSAEAEWAQAANHVIEKDEDENDVNEDVLSVNRSKRRLILTTQLMQQVLRPPPAVVLSLDASLNYEIVAYFVARLGLGDACSLICRLESKLRLNSGNLLSEKLKKSGRIRDQYFLKFVEDFICRASTLENDLLRLDKRASMMDLRLECQDLERFSVINRFAKFHGRGQANEAETSLSFRTTATAQQTCPQRYVTAHQMPQNLPDGVQCLSL
ncbi:hypothetical protein Nepgr_023741 [Nepenthes gracilis]|uniref:Uncharacterized protein n=1 Tax=Nepenthes gracilis TaxID=150966 RepID=A0AAD3XY44_NEPGR|nr:hypothetical protein Nepgr_023741 [Nepenthes gracilis]